MADHADRSKPPGAERRQSAGTDPGKGVSGQHGGDTGLRREQNREGQNQSAEPDDAGGQPGQEHDLAGMRGSTARQARGERVARQGQPGERGDSEGEHGGNR